MDLDEVKAIIKGLVISLPTGMTVDRLQKDFREQEGIDIPYRQYQHNTLPMFLRSLTDTVMLQGDLVIPIVDEKVAHIKNMISKQKINAKGKYGLSRAQPQQRGPNRSTTRYYQPLYRPPFTPHYSKNYSQYFPHQQPPLPQYQHQRQYQQYRPNPTNSPSNVAPLMTIKFPQTYKFTNAKNTKTSASCSSFDRQEKSKKEESSRCEDRDQKTVTVPAAVESVIDERSTKEPEAAVADVVLQDWCDDEDFIYSTEEEEEGDDDDAHGCCSGDVSFQEENYTTARIPDYIKTNLRVLIKENPDGIWCAKLPEMYRKRFGKRLNYEELGYNRLMTMCGDVGLFHLVFVDKCDHKLYDIDLPLPEDAHVSVYYRTRYNLDDDINYYNEYDKSAEDAIPNDALVSNHLYPPDVMNPDDDIPYQWLTDDMEQGQYFRLKIGEIYDPSKFWIILDRPECGDRLDEMMNAMQEFYVLNKTALKIPRLAIVKNMIACTMFMKEFHRCTIMKFVQGEDKVKVYFFDYGTVGTVKMDNIYYLHRDFSLLSRQAIRARLIGVYPPMIDTPWSREASSRFLNLVYEKSLMAYLHRIDESMFHLDVVLYDRIDADNEVAIGDVLVEEGFAVNRRVDREKPLYGDDAVVPIVKNIHLFPTFEELETAAVPTAFETNLLLSKGCTTDFLYPHYYSSYGNSIRKVCNNSNRTEEQTTCSNTLTDTFNKESHYYVPRTECTVKNEESGNNEAGASSSWLKIIDSIEEDPKKTAPIDAQRQESEAKPLPGFNEHYLQTLRARQPLSLPLPQTPLSAAPSSLDSPIATSTPKPPPGFHNVPTPPSMFTNPNQSFVNANTVTNTTCSNNNVDSAAYLSALLAMSQPLHLNPYLRTNPLEQLLLMELMKQKNAYNMHNLHIIMQQLNIGSAAPPPQQPPAASPSPVPDTIYGDSFHSETIDCSIMSTNSNFKSNVETGTLHQSEVKPNLQQYRKWVFQRALESTVVHVILFEGDYYMLTDEVIKKFTKFGHISSNQRYKAVVMGGCVLPSKEIDLLEHKSLLNELEQVNLEEPLSNMLSMIQLSKVHSFLTSLGQNAIIPKDLDSIVKSFEQPIRL